MVSIGLLRKSPCSAGMPIKTVDCTVIGGCRRRDLAPGGGSYDGAKTVHSFGCKRLQLLDNKL